MDPVFGKIWTGVFLIEKTIIGRFANKKLLEHRPMIVFPIRSCARPEFVRARRGRGFFSTQRLQICADWVLSTQSSPAVCAFGGWSRPEDGRVRGIFLARIWVGATRRGFSLHRDRGFVEIGFYLHRDCRYIGRCGTRSEMTLLFSSQMQTKFRRRFRVVFS